MSCFWTLLSALVALFLASKQGPWVCPWTWVIVKAETEHGQHKQLPLASPARKPLSERFPLELFPEAGGLPAWGCQPFPGYIWRIRAAQPCVTLAALVQPWTAAVKRRKPHLRVRMKQQVCRRQGGGIAHGHGVASPSRGGDSRADIFIPIYWALNGYIPRK